MKLTPTQHQALDYISRGYVKHVHPLTFTASSSAPPRAIGWICAAGRYRTLDGVLRKKLAKVVAIKKTFRDVELTAAGHAALSAMEKKNGR